MFRRSSIRLFFTYSINGTTSSLLPLPRACCAFHQTVPATVTSPIHFNFSPRLCHRQYNASSNLGRGDIQKEEADRVTGEIGLKFEQEEETHYTTGGISVKSELDEDDEDTAELDLKAYEVEDEDDDDLPPLRYEDYEPEIKIFEDPDMDREPPPEPSEETKRNVDELVEILRKIPYQKNRKKKGNGGRQDFRMHHDELLEQEDDDQHSNEK